MRTHAHVMWDCILNNVYNFDTTVNIYHFLKQAMNSQINVTHIVMIFTCTIKIWKQFLCLLCENIINDCNSTNFFVQQEILTAKNHTIKLIN